MINNNYKLLATLTVAPLILTACGSSGSSNSKQDTFETQYSAVIATLASDYTSSDIEIVALNNDSMTAVSGISTSDLSDYTVMANGQYFYKIGRYSIDTVTRFDIDDANNAQQIFSTLDDANDTTSNPYTLVFASETKAYLLRYNSPIAWIVDPSASDQASFKLGEIDLSAYIEDNGDGAVEMADGAVEMADGAIVDGKLYIIMQRSVWFDPSINSAYIAVIDTNSDEEIDTGADSGDLKGIPLETRNPGSIQYVAGAGLFVQAVGDYGSTYEPIRPVSYIGGIEKIDPDDYSTEIVVDDGDDDNHPYGQISAMAIVDENTGYFVGYAGWQNTTLYEFNPSTGAVNDSAVLGLAGLDIANITMGPQNKLWVSVDDFAEPRVLVIDPENVDAMITIPTLMNPTTIAFTEIEVETGP